MPNYSLPREELIGHPFGPLPVTVGASNPFDHAARWLLQDGSVPVGTEQNVAVLGAVTDCLVKCLTASTFIALWTDNSANTKAMIIQVDFTVGTYTLGTAVAIGSGAQQLNGIFVTSSTSFVIATIQKFYACTVAGTVITAGTGVSYQGGTGRLSIIQGFVTKTTFMVLNYTGTVINALYATVSGTTMTVGSFASIGATIATGGGAFMRGVAVASARACFIFEDSSKNQAYAQLVTFDEAGSVAATANGAKLALQLCEGGTVDTLSLINTDYKNGSVCHVAFPPTGLDAYIYFLSVGSAAADSLPRAMWQTVRYNQGGDALVASRENALSFASAGFPWAGEFAMVNGCIKDINSELAAMTSIQGSTVISIFTTFYYKKVYNTGRPILLKSCPGMSLIKTADIANTPAGADFEINAAATGGLLLYYSTAASVVQCIAYKLPTLAQ